MKRADILHEARIFPPSGNRWRRGRCGVVLKFFYRRAERRSRLGMIEVGIPCRAEHSERSQANTGKPLGGCSRLSHSDIFILEMQSILRSPSMPRQAPCSVEGKVQRLQLRSARQLHILPTTRAPPLILITRLLKHLLFANHPSLSKESEECSEADPRGLGDPTFLSHAV